MRVVLLTALGVLLSACSVATTSPHTTTRAERSAIRDAREARLIELAKRHPNAVPRERSELPEDGPSYTDAGFRIDLKRRGLR